MWLVDLAALADNTDFPSELPWKEALIQMGPIARLAAPISRNWDQIA
jgi:hypothetical protein